jgi:FAD/FMN-containing dehydrogenase
VSPQLRGVILFFAPHKGEQRVRAAYPGATWDRLARIKAKYDPTNLFSQNQNVSPASEDAA